MKENSEVIIIQEEEEGIRKISERIEENREIQRVHIVSHGAPGCIYIGKRELRGENLKEYEKELRKWKGSEKGKKLELLIYGCNVGEGNKGAELIKELREITGAEIAASENRTGSKEKGGDWNLEIRAGKIEPSLGFKEEVRESYTGILAEPVLVKDILPGIGSSNLSELTVSNNELYFTADDGSTGSELWKSDGTVSGTVLVKDINSGSGSSSPSELTVSNNELYFSNNKLYFTADDGVNGSELFVLDPNSPPTTTNNINGYGTNNTLNGTSANDLIKGKGGSDILKGKAGDDIINGGSGADEIRGNSGNDLLTGDGGDDLLLGGQNNDTLVGGNGRDTLRGNTGDDLLDGGKGVDEIRGGAGNDLLIGGAGKDILIGGDNSDQFVLIPDSGEDTIRDFQDGIDTLALTIDSGITFSDLDISTNLSGDAVIRLGLNGQRLATVENVTAEMITEAEDITFV